MHLKQVDRLIVEDTHREAAKGKRHLLHVQGGQVEPDLQPQPEGGPAEPIGVPGLSIRTHQRVSLNAQLCPTMGIFSPPENRSIY